MNVGLLRKTALAGGLLLLYLISCDDNSAGPDKEELTGTWNAVKIEFTDRNNSEVVVDVVEEGVTAEMTFEEDGTYRLKVVRPEEPGLDVVGTWSTEGYELTVQWTVEPFSNTWQFDMELDGDRLFLDGAHSNHDFDGDGINDPAILDFELLKV